jgi:uncharacterized protein YyaL (SSP411 family)
MDTASNRLGEETSPYLLQHKDNPVHWQAWSEAALAAAAATDRPVLLSVGYAACHWCHVMAHESFEDPATAALMNAHFVNIKVDREERPDLDAIYQHALALLGEQGGWPLTMFLTPAGEPFWGGTYFPPEPRWGRPSFRQVLLALSNAYKNDREKVAANAGALREALGRLGRPQGGADISREAMDQAAYRLLREVDLEDGGIGGAPKFPQCGIFELLWRAWRRTGDRRFRDAVTVTLDTMAQGGIYDHLGGGYARYSTDARWLVPHFEKMLYDNAELISLMSLVYAETKSPLYAARIAETIDWLAREMTQPEGGFSSSLDADSEHEEGKFYVWSEAEIDRLLGHHRAALFKKHYDVTAEGNWEGKVILNRSRLPAFAEDAVEEELAACRALLFRARAERVRPGLDDKVLADWNGLMIAALAEAAQLFDRPDWLDLAADAFTFVASQMTGPDGRLLHSWRADRARHPAILEDYANLCRAGLALFEATGDAQFLQRVERWVAILDRHYWDAAGGGYFTAADDTPALITRAKTASDAAVPSGNGTMLGVLARLFYMTGTERHREKADALLGAFAGELQRNLFPLATLINNAELYRTGLQIVLSGKRDDADTRALRRVVLETSLPNRILLEVEPSAALSESHPAAGKIARDGKAAVYICKGPVCSLPLTDPSELAEALAKSG